MASPRPIEQGVVHVPQSFQARLLGELQFTHDGSPLESIDSARLQSLSAYLLLHRDIPQLRSKLAFAFWPNSSEKQALTNFRHLLHNLRKALPRCESYLSIDAKNVTLKANGTHLSDVTRFQALLKQAKQASETGNAREAYAKLEQAIEVYNGPFMPGFYEDWINAEREQLQQAYTGALDKLISLAENRRDYSAAIHFAKRRLAEEPSRESVYVTLMRLYSISGDRSAALEAFRQCEAILSKELDVEPSRETIALKEQLLKDSPQSQERPVDTSDELPLMGRHLEWRQLCSLWKTANAGKAKLVTLIGEAGIGKTRLAEELLKWAEAQGGIAARSRSYSAEGRLAYAPATQWLRTPALLKNTKELDTEWKTEISRILPELHLGAPEEFGQDLNPTIGQKQRLFEALSRAVLAGGQPLILLIDDLQWTDEETLQWLCFLLRFAPKAPLLIVGTIREEEMNANRMLEDFLLDLKRDDSTSEIKLGPLELEETALIAKSLAGRALSDDESARLHSDTEGNPLFIVESIRAGLEDDGSGSPNLPTPFESTGIAPKVHAVIAKRFSLLSDAGREFMNIAAAIGRAFSFEALLAVSGEGEDDAAEALDELLRHRIVAEPEGGELYDFSHDKLREVAYNGIAKHRKRILHRRVAEYLESRYASKIDSVSAQAAYHFELAGKTNEAIGHYQKAAEGAKRLHAENEAARLYQKALDLAENLPEGTERAELELELNTALGVSLVAVQGYPAAKALTVYERARALCKQLGRRSEPPIIRGLALSSLTRGQLQDSTSLGYELMQRFDETGDPIIGVEANYTLAVSCFWLGQFEKAEGFFNKAISGYNPAHSGIHMTLYAQDPMAVCLCRRAWNLWYLGYPDQASAQIERAVDFVAGIDHLHTKAYVYHFSAHICYDLGDRGQVSQLLEKFDDIGDDHPFTFWDSRVEVLKMLCSARFDGNIESIQKAEALLNGYVSTGGTIGYSNYFAYVAELNNKHGLHDDAKRCLARAHDFFTSSDEQFSKPELARIEGEIVLSHSRDTAKAEALFQKARQSAKDQKSKWMELRASTSLARLWNQNDKRKQTRELLLELLDWFKEGRDSEEIQAAKRLLETERG